ncbi:MAG TPA: hypothetical protein VLK25_00990 [Allosphingosinicella sp.]|nr:hypothetical protein [Allosphingosinicella sp.]
MTKVRFGAAVLFALAGSGALASAQNGIGGEEALAAQAMRNFAICAADRSPGGARDLLVADRHARSYPEAVRRFARGHNDCASGATLRFGGILLRGGLAEGLLRAPLRDAGLASLVAHDPSRPAIAADNASDAMALCTVREAPAAVEALLAAEPGTAAEDVAAAALPSTMTACLTAGQQLQANRSGLRALLAISAFRLVEHNRVSGAR